MRQFISLLPILFFAACIGPFVGKKSTPWLAPPPVLKADFTSATAAAHLVWDQVPAEGFLRYDIQRSAGGDFHSVAQVGSVSDTSFIDEGLLANTSYRYRVLSIFGEKEKIHQLEH